MRIALAQINTTVGDLQGNAARIESAVRHAAGDRADLVVFPELAITGYPPRDLLSKPGFVRRNLEVLESLAARLPVPALVGHVARAAAQPGRELANAASLLGDGRILATRSKSLLPTYDVFDEDRYFEPAEVNQPVPFRGRKLGVTICEDLWNDEDFWPLRRYRRNPASELVDAGADLLLNLSASPWHLGKDRTRRAMLSGLVRKHRCPLLYCNLVGGNDELVFDGGSLVFDSDGTLRASGASFAEDMVWFDDRACGAGAVETSVPLDDLRMVYQALVLGLRDYLHKCRFTSAVLGLSGGIDSALVACLAAEALGPENVLGVSLPSPFSSQGSLDDARSLAQNLGIRYQTIPIHEGFQALKKSLAPMFEGLPEDTTEENLQARLRGLLLMGLSNKFGSLLLTTGNKSELAVGYCTLYGDMCGGLAVISDVPKTLVYELARWINRSREVIPSASISKPPSAELRPNQTDQDSLPPYEILDAILEAYVVHGRAGSEIAASGFAPDVVDRVTRLIDLSEYKRRQAAPGLKVTTKAFGVGRRFPIAQCYRDL